MSLLALLACVGSSEPMTLDQALDRIDAAGREPETLTLAVLSRSLGADLVVGGNAPGRPFERVQIWDGRAGVEAHFYFESSVCFTEQAARERYGHLFANVGGHRPLGGREWVAQPEGYRLTLGVDDNGCVRRLGLSD